MMSDSMSRDLLTIVMTGTLLSPIACMMMFGPGWMPLVIATLGFVAVLMVTLAITLGPELNPPDESELPKATVRRL